MPAMILKFTKWNDKTETPFLLPGLYQTGQGVYRIRYLVLAAVIIITPPAIWLNR